MAHLKNDRVDNESGVVVKVGFRRMFEKEREQVLWVFRVGREGRRCVTGRRKR